MILTIFSAIDCALIAAYKWRRFCFPSASMSSLRYFIYKPHYRRHRIYLFYRRLPCQLCAPILSIVARNLTTARFLLTSSNGASYTITDMYESAILAFRMYRLQNTEAYRSGHNEAVLKTVWRQRHGGSNPSASAKSNRVLTPTKHSTFS